MAISVTGAAAAAGTVVCWTTSALLFERAGRRIGSLNVNVVRLAVALGLFSITMVAVHGTPLPLNMSPGAWRWLLISGVVGMCLGDMCLFQAYLDIGPRLTMLIMSLVPPLSMAIGGLWFDESYLVGHWCGTAMTVVGVVWVLGLRPAASAPAMGRAARSVSWRGIALACGAACGQAIGFVTAKQGMTDMRGAAEALAATQVRVIAGMAGFIVVFTVLGLWPGVRRALTHASGMALTSGGAVAGPFLGVFLMMLALQFASSGAVATIIALIPLVLIPVVVLVDRERVSLSAIGGTLLAVSGVSWLVLT